MVKRVGIVNTSAPPKTLFDFTTWDQISEPDMKPRIPGCTLTLRVNFRRHSILSRPWGYHTVFAHVTWMKTCEIARNITKRDRSRPDLQKCQVSCACQTETICSKGAAEKIHLKMKAQLLSPFLASVRSHSEHGNLRGNFPRDCPLEPPRPPANRQSSRVNPHGKNTLRGHMWTHWLAKENQTISDIQMSRTKCLLKHVQGHGGDWYFKMRPSMLDCESVNGFLNVTALGVMLLFLEIHILVRKGVFLELNYKPVRIS